MNKHGKMYFYHFTNVGEYPHEVRFGKTYVTAWNNLNDALNEVSIRNESYRRGVKDAKRNLRKKLR